ncbi:CDF-like metal transporter [Lactarius akahatsu]|uniref:CDF-like metal transporter n=1 Tax=Lactarius akahatsu TaxID=416441 RepID=A0AAD4Q9B1_9AGAM|nr:CDF-like metal transporter [Lactarius akahatsu]
MASLPTMILGFRLSYHLRRPVPPLRCSHNSLLRLSHTPLSLVHRYHRIEESEHRSNRTQPTSHSHSHGILGGHSHSHEHGDHDHGGGLIETLERGGDRGSRVTLIGLGANILLTSAKGAAGWSMNSAALLADAGHSLSDLLGDFVVLFAWRLSRRPPSRRYPFGLAKFETVGTGLVALLLIGGALGICAHSLSLLLSVLSETASSVAAGPLQTALINVTEAAHHIPAIGQFAHSHAHHAHALDLNAAWFAAVSVASKEWLFRITRKVAEQESSPVLLANAYHHRSDAYSSFVALVAILGSGLFPTLPLDPIGGLIVSFVIFGQGLSVLKGAFWEMTDASVSTPVLQSLSRPLNRLVEDPRWSTCLLHVHDIRARRAGAQLFVDFSAGVPEHVTAFKLDQLEKEMVAALKAERKDVKEVHVRFEVVSEATEQR